MQIGKLLERKGRFVATIKPDATVWQALAVLDSQGIGALVVSADGRAAIGIISERDIVRRLHDRGAPVLDGPVSDIMVSDLFCAAPSDDVDSLMAVMTARRIRHVPVVSGGELSGIVSIGDVVKHRLDALEDDKRALMDFIHAR